MKSVTEQMRADWNKRAREDAHYYVAFGGRDQDEDEFLATASDELRFLDEELKRFPNDANRRAWRALEIGCGPGRLMKPLSRSFGEIHGVDVSDEMVKIARERLRGIPHAHVHATNGASLALFADDSFDFIYSYAVFQHIPSRDVIFEYMREIHRVLKPGGIFRGQFNGLAHTDIPDTWSGAVLSAEDIHTFTRDNGLHLLDIIGVRTQYMWTTWRKPLPPGAAQLPPVIHRATNAHSWEPVVPNRGRHAAISIWMRNVPHECDLNSLEVLVEGAPGVPFYIGPPGVEGLQQVNAWLPENVRTGLVPVELCWNSKPLCPPTIVRIIPAGPLVPRIVSIRDGVNMVLKNGSSTGLIKIQIEEIHAQEPLSASVSGKPAEILQTICVDPRAPRYEVNLRLPKGLSVGYHTLHVQFGRRKLLPADIQISPPNGVS
jgi:SAM-dependent methyltransferase